MRLNYVGRQLNGQRRVQDGGFGDLHRPANRARGFIVIMISRGTLRPLGWGAGSIRYGSRTKAVGPWMLVRMDMPKRHGRLERKGEQREVAEAGTKPEKQHVVSGRFGSSTTLRLGQAEDNPSSERCASVVLAPLVRGHRPHNSD